MKTIDGKQEISCRTIILKTAVGSRKSAQPLDAPRKYKNWIITKKVTTQFVHSLCTSIACTAFSRSTAAFRIINPASNDGDSNYYPDDSISCAYIRCHAILLLMRLSIFCQATGIATQLPIAAITGAFVANTTNE